MLNHRWLQCFDRPFDIFAHCLLYDHSKVDGDEADLKSQDSTNNITFGLIDSSWDLLDNSRVKAFAWALCKKGLHF